MTLGQGVFIGGVARGRATYVLLPIVVRSYSYGLRVRERSAVRLPGTISPPVARFSGRKLADHICLFLKENDHNLFFFSYESTVPSSPFLEDSLG